MIDVFLALIFAITGSFLVFWLTVICVIATLWIIPIAVLCLVEVGVLVGEICLAALRPLAWLALLLRERNESNNHLRVTSLNLDNGRRGRLHRLPTRGSSNSSDHQDAGKFYRVRPL